MVFVLTIYSKTNIKSHKILVTSRRVVAHSPRTRYYTSSVKIAAGIMFSRVNIQKPFLNNDRSADDTRINVSLNVKQSYTRPRDTAA